MAKNAIAIKVGVRKMESVKSPGYGKYYVEVLNNETITTRALLEHIMSHGLGYPRSIVQGVLTQIAECLTELILQGQPVKLDGFGTFKLTADTVQGGIQPAVAEAAGFNPVDYLDGLHLVVIPDNTELDKLTSKANLAKATISMQGKITRESAGTTSTGKPKYAKVVTPMAVATQPDPEPEP